VQQRLEKIDLGGSVHAQSSSGFAHRQF